MAWSLDFLELKMSVCLCSDLLNVFLFLLTNNFFCFSFIGNVHFLLKKSAKISIFLLQSGENQGI